MDGVGAIVFTFADGTRMGVWISTGKVIVVDGIDIQHTDTRITTARIAEGPHKGTKSWLDFTSLATGPDRADVFVYNERANVHFTMSKGLKPLPATTQVIRADVVALRA